MSNLASHQLQDFPILAENYHLIGIWVCWLSGSAALANYHAMQLRSFYGDEIAARKRVALLKRNWLDEFDASTRSMLSYIELLTRKPQHVSQRHRDNLVGKGYSKLEIQEIDRAVHDFRQASLVEQGLGEPGVAKKRAPTGRRRRRHSVSTPSSYRPVMRTMHNRFEGLGSDAKFGSKLFDVYFRISVGMALGCGLAMWLGYDDNLRSFLGSSLRNHTMVNGIATGLLVSVPVNSFYLLWRSIRQSYARNHNQPVPKFPLYVGRPAFALAFVTTLISIWA